MSQTMTADRCTAADAALIAKFIAERGVTHLPPAAAEFTSAEIPPEARKAIADHNAEQSARWLEKHGGRITRKSVIKKKTDKLRSGK